MQPLRVLLTAAVTLSLCTALYAAPVEVFAEESTDGFLLTGVDVAVNDAGNMGYLGSIVTFGGSFSSPSVVRLHACPIPSGPACTELFREDTTGFSLTAGAPNLRVSVAVGGALDGPLVVAAGKWLDTTVIFACSDATCTSKVVSEAGGPTNVDYVKVLRGGGVGGTFPVIVVQASSFRPSTWVIACDNVRCVNSTTTTMFADDVSKFDDGYAASALDGRPFMSGWVRSSSCATSAVLGSCSTTACSNVSSKAVAVIDNECRRDTLSLGLAGMGIGAPIHTPGLPYVLSKNREDNTYMLAKCDTLDCASPIVSSLPNLADRGLFYQAAPEYAPIMLTTFKVSGLDAILHLVRCTAGDCSTPETVHVVSTTFIQAYCGSSNADGSAVAAAYVDRVNSPSKSVMSFYFRSFASSDYTPGVPVASAAAPLAPVTASVVVVVAVSLLSLARSTLGEL